MECYTRRGKHRGTFVYTGLTAGADVRNRVHKLASKLNDMVGKPEHFLEHKQLHMLPDRNVGNQQTVD